MSGRRPVRSPNCIPRLMAERGLSCAQLGEASGLARSRVNDFKNGWRIPNVHTAIRLARALGVPVEYVWGRTDG